MKRVLPYIHYLSRITRGYRRVIALRTLLGVVKVLVMLVFVWLSKTAIDCATGRVPTPTATLAVWFGLMVACMVVDLLLGQCVRYLESRNTMLLTNSIDRRLFGVLMTLPFEGHKPDFHSGDMLNRLTLDVRAIATFAVNQLPSMVVMAVQLAASFAFLAWLNPCLAVAPIVIMPLCLLAGKLYFRRQRTITADIRSDESRAHVAMQEGLRHRMLIRSLECVDVIERRLASVMQQLDASNHRQARLSAASGALTRLGFVAGYLTAFGWGIFSLKAGVITFGTMTAFLQLVNRIQNPIAALASYMPSFVSTSVAVDRLRDIDLPLPSPEPSQSVPRAGIRVSNLWFRYDDGGHHILSAFSHDFRPGSRTMIVGATGAGKTTLIRLLLGLLSPQSGMVEIYGDGKVLPVSSATLCNFVYVPQGNTLLHGTIRDNLLLGAPQATDEQLACALHTAVADFVHSLPLGLDTPCHEAGGGLSEGQAQRIAIARALLRPGSILVLDECNSALDSATAATLMQRLAQSHPHSTVIIIAHHQGAVAPFCDDVLTISSRV